MSLHRVLLRSRAPLTLLLGLTLSLSFPGWVSAQDDAEADASASIRFVHASPDAPAIDILVNGQALAQGLEFGSVTEFAPVSEGDLSIQVVPAGQTAESALIDESVEVDGDNAYIVAVANLLNSLELKVVESNLEDLPENEARTRFVNLSPDDATVDVGQVGGDEWFDDVEFGETTDHRNVEAGAYELDVLAHDADTVIVPGLQVDLTPGTEVTLILIGTQQADTLQVLTLNASASVPCAVQLGLSGTPEDACVRVTNAAVDGVAVDVYVEESLVVENLEPGSTSEFIALPADDDRSFVLVPAGSAIEEQILDSSIDLDSGQTTDVFIGGAVDDLKAINAELDLSPVASDQSRVRAVNLSHDAGAIDLIVTDGDTLFGGVEFESVTDSILMDADTYDIQVQEEGDDSVLLTSDALVIEPGMTYSLVAAGSVDAGTFTILVVSAPAQVLAGDATAEPAASAEATPLGDSSPTPAAEEVNASPTS